MPGEELPQDFPRMEVVVNGERTQVPARQSVAEMLIFLKLPSDRVAVELDRVLVRKRDWEKTAVRPDSQIEIVEFIGGG